MQSEKIDILVKALARVQRDLDPAVKNATNPFFQSKYADLESVWDSCRELLTDAGLVVIQTMDDTDGGITLITTLAHESGQYISGRLRMNPEKNTPQGIGSAITYARRYALAAMVGIVTDDDDGNEATKPKARAMPQRVTVTPPRAPQVAPQEPKPPEGEPMANNEFFDGMEPPILSAADAASMMGAEVVGTKSLRSGGVKCITDPQRKRFYAMYKAAGISDAIAKQYLKEYHGVESSKEIPMSIYDTVCKWAEGGQ